MRRAVLAVLLLVVSGCTGGDSDGDSAGETEPGVAFEWRSVELPAPAGEPGRLAVRDAIRCGDRWFVTGGVFTGPGLSRPAMWRSRDGESWESVEMRPEEYWAQRSVISSMACHDDDIAMVGAKSGGAHGNPRVSTWIRADDGAYVDVQAPFEQYGGPEAINVGIMAGGSQGFLIVGNRFSGAAVWVSADGQEFELIDDDPELGKREELDPLGVGVTAAGSEWIVVGSAQRKDRVPRVPLAWSSTDGRIWKLEEVPHGDENTSLERVVATDEGELAVGLRGDEFGVWERTGAGWRSAGTFGDLVDDSTGTAYVYSLSADGDLILAAVSDREVYRLYASADLGDAWSEVMVPVQPAPAGEQILAATSAEGRVLLLADDARQGRVWIADIPGS